MKKILCVTLAVLLLLGLLPAAALAAPGDTPLFSTDFSTAPADMELNGSAKIENDQLILDGSSGCYANLESGLLNGLNTVTISFDVTTNMASGNFFTFAIGQNNSKYFYLRLRGGSGEHSGNYYGAITKTGFGGETSIKGLFPEQITGKKQSVTLVFDGTTVALYLDGRLARANYNLGAKLSDLGENAQILFGKSFYEPDQYFNGTFDNIRIYGRAMTAVEIAEAYSQKTAQQLDYEALTIPNAQDIRDNISLPSVGEYGTSITWSSPDNSANGVITLTEQGGKPAGVVTRGTEDKTVKLQADVGGQTKDFILTVKAAPESLDEMYGYLFVRFRGLVFKPASASEEQTYFSLSRDGLHWTDLNCDANGQAQPVLTSNIATKGVRDHFIARSPHGDKFYMIATDLSVYYEETDGSGNSWPNAGTRGSHSIVVWESTDLVNWSEPRLEEVARADAGCTWAPEFIYDETTAEYVVFWASTTTQQADMQNHSIYYCKTRDFHTFTEPQVYHAGGEDANGTTIKVIDSTMIENNGTYYRYTKNESTGNIEIDKSNAVLGDFTTIQSDTLSTTLPAAQGPVEGPIIFKMNEKTADGKDQWCLMVDRFGWGRGYYPMITTDLESGEFTLLDASQFSFPEHYRHGYVLPITKAEYDVLEKEWGNQNARPASDENGLFYSETFDDEETGSMTLHNGAAVTGGVLTLTGGNANTNSPYASLPYGWMNGLDEATIAFDVKSEMDNGYFFTFTICQDTNRYLFFRNRSNGYYTAITTGSNPGESGITVPASDVKSQWHHVAMTFQGKTFALYVDGAKVGEQMDSRASLADLGEDAKIWFGKSPWPDPYFAGSFDNIKLYSRALGEQEIVTLSAGNVLGAISLKNADAILTDFTLPTVEGVEITWTSNNAAVTIENGVAKVHTPVSDTNVILTASVTVDSVTATKEFPITVIANGMTLVKDSLAIPYAVCQEMLPTELLGARISWSQLTPGKEQTLTAKITLGDQTEQKTFTVKAFEAAGQAVAYRIADGKAVAGQTDAMALATYEKGALTKLNKEKPVLYAKTCDTKGNALEQPFVFRAKEGFAVIGTSATQPGSVLLFESDDLIAYSNERSVKLSDSAITEVEAFYGSDGLYHVFYAAGGRTYAVTSADLTTFSAAQAVSHVFQQADVPATAEMADVSASFLTAAELTVLHEQFDTIVNTTVDFPSNLTLEQGDPLALPDRVTAHYSDGSTKSLGVTYDLSQITLDKPGTYTVTGTVEQPTYQEPLIEERADPFIIYNEDDGYYYFTASYPMQSYTDPEGYDRVILRRAKTIQDLADAQEVTIWNEESSDTCHKYIWAPELHKIGGSWYILTTSSKTTDNVYALSPTLLKCNNPDDMMNPASWGEPVRVKAMEGDQTFVGMSLDMTYFSAGGKHYLAWADCSRGASSIFLATIDPADPTQLTSPAVVIAAPNYSWEDYGIPVNEGAAVILHDGTVYMAFSAASTGSEYCVGMLTADENADLLDPASWTKGGTPVMTTAHFTNGLSGPGHNSFTVDEYGNPVIVYHARPKEHLTEHNGGTLWDPCRHARVKTVHFAADGRLILDMMPEEELLPENKTFTFTVTVRGEDGGETKPPVNPGKPTNPGKPVVPDTHYSDVAVGSWYYEAVSYVTEEGLMTGVGNGKFNPNGAVTRAMVWTVLARMAGENTEGGATWYAKAQSWAMETGVSDGTNPMGSITREQLATMLYRYEGSPAVSGNLSAYPDANQVSDWAVDAMVWATQEGIINGINGYLRSQDGATRAQLAAMLMRLS